MVDTYKLTPFEEKLLAGWESVYKMGQLSLWLMLALKDSPKHMAQIKEFVIHGSGHALTADDKSIYRSLRKFDKTGLISFTVMHNPNGPDLKLYTLTDTGKHVLHQFLARNICIFYEPDIHKLIERN